MKTIKKETKEQLPICCLCGGFYEHIGHNPYPLKRNEEDRCCGICNYTKVIPARISLLANNEVGGTINE